MTLRAYLQAERERIAQVVRDETWLEGERRGCYVPHDDPAVQARVAAIILSDIGRQLRQELDPTSEAIA